ncbi:MAG: hypothetical protein ACKVQJ_02060 [Pyrinomonadaceae bacterium]
MVNIGKLWLFIVVAFFSAAAVSAQDLKPEALVANHLEAIGKKDVRDGLKTLFAVGVSEFESRIPVVKGGGKAIVVSDPENLFFVISLNSKEYPFEKIGYFGGKANLPFISAGRRSLLGLFINENERILSDGLFGGSMSLHWALLDPETRKAKLKSAGMKKIDGKKLYALDYFTSNGGSTDFTIRLFFDEKFNHVRSEYRREVVQKEGTFGQANLRASAVILLTEEFSDFRSVDGITLPYAYKVDFSSNSNSSSNENIWRIKVEQYYYNQKLAPDFFTFDVK